MMEHGNKLSGLFDTMCAFPIEQELAPEYVSQMSKELKEKQEESRKLQADIRTLNHRLTRRMGSFKMARTSVEGPFRTSSNLNVVRQAHTHAASPGTLASSGFEISWQAPTHAASPATALMQSAQPLGEVVGGEEAPTTAPPASRAANVSGSHPCMDPEMHVF